MPKERFTDAQITFALRQAKAQTSGGNIFPKVGAAVAIFRRRKKVQVEMGGKP
ncbi:hypothetical protein OEZ60_14640 [Defluviimonas sp. WL0024]|uniref:Transposase n=1 Tax=Albidovulum salinarum TaxID=2984153 RepID=A0ABT2X5N3_9RHOB|nr:hypothetical protein [Defluviimonas sp. WL0024]MCU9849239.1 hypothetical protein [Defluviimonas sp. WL0024]